MGKQKTTTKIQYFCKKSNIKNLHPDHDLNPEILNLHHELKKGHQVLVIITSPNIE